jgi:hypothetical protein
MVDLAVEGESWAIKQVADRLDGKAAQEVNVEADVTNYVISSAPLSDDEWEAAYCNEAEGKLNSESGPARGGGLAPDPGLRRPRNSASRGFWRRRGNGVASEG